MAQGFVTLRHTIAIAGACALAGCSDRTDPAADHARKIDCGVGGATVFTADCAVEDVTQDGHRLLIVRHKDGGFRRFEAVTDGRGVIPADGIEGAAATWISNTLLEIAVGPDRYRFPATMKPDHAPKS